MLCSDQSRRKYLRSVTRTRFIAGFSLFICIADTAPSAENFTVQSQAWMIAGSTWGWPVPSSQLWSACPSVSGEWQFLNTCVKINSSECDQQVDVDWNHLFYHISLNTNAEVSLWCEGNKGIRRMPKCHITMPSRKKARIHALSGPSTRRQENNF